MKSLLLTSNCDCFVQKYENKSLTLSWKTQFDFTHVLYVGLTKIQIIGVMSEDYELFPVYCNLIERTTCNPLREIHRISVDPYVDVINESTSGKTVL